MQRSADGFCCLCCHSHLPLPGVVEESNRLTVLVPCSCCSSKARCVHPPRLRMCVS
jgi:hypothetical protein